MPDRAFPGPLPGDRYLRLACGAGRMLRGEAAPTELEPCSPAPVHAHTRLKKPVPVSARSCRGSKRKNTRAHKPPAEKSPAAGIKLGDILNIEYGSAEIRTSSRPFLLDPCGPSIKGDIAPDIEPQDLKAEDTVTVMWKIEP